MQCNVLSEFFLLSCCPVPFDLLFRWIKSILSCFHRFIIFIPNTGLDKGTEYSVIILASTKRHGPPLQQISHLALPRSNSDCPIAFLVDYANTTDVSRISPFTNHPISAPSGLGEISLILPFPEKLNATWRDKWTHRVRF